MKEIRDTALRLAAHGWPVFPCVPNRKEPLVPHGFQDACTDPDVIRLWWQQWPGANLAVATGAPAVDVVDVDVKAVNGMPALERLESAGLLAGALGRVQTPSGGLHIFFRGTEQGNGSLRFHGIDFRGRGGYVLLPPSAIDGKQYQVLEWRHGARGQAVNWEACRQLLQPPQVGATMRPRSDQGSDVTALARWLARQPEGGRNNCLYWASCRAVEAGHGGDLDVLVDAAVAAGLKEREARRTVESAARRLGAA